MEIKKENYVYDNVMEVEDEDSIASRRFMSGVFIWMFVALGISAVTAYGFSTNASLLQLIVNPTTGGPTGLGMLAMFSPIIFALVMRFGLNSISYPVLAVLFIAFSAIMGMSLSFILLVYATTSVVGVFISSSLIFAVMAFAGYYTRQDLTQFGTILWVALVGAILASIVNWFLGSAQLDYILSFIFLAVFIGLTAYKVQMLKRIGAGLEYGTATAQKLALMGAFTLYITFINLFLTMLRLFGRRR